MLHDIKMTNHEIEKMLLYFAVVWTGGVVGWALVKYICSDFDEPREEDEPIVAAAPQKKIETRAQTNMMRTRSYKNKMSSSKYYAIYNLSRGERAHDLSGGDDAEKVWRDNHWSEGDALIGYWYDDGPHWEYTIIHCEPGYAVYVSDPTEHNEAHYTLNETPYQLPIAILMNLNDAADSEFLHTKSNPSKDDKSKQEKPSKKRARALSDVDDDTPQIEWSGSPAGSRRIQADCSDNQPIVDFLYRCYDATTHPFKRKAYARAIDSISSMWRPVTITNYWNDWNCSQHILPAGIGASINRKIREFLDGVVEEDIMAEPKKVRATAKCVKKRARKADVDDTPQVEWPGGWRIVADVPGNQPIVDFLYKCYDANSNTFKRKAYARAIAEIGSYWAGDLTKVGEYSLPRVLPKLSGNMIRKIHEFLEGFPEEDIIHS